MIRIMLCCSAGMSTSMLVRKMVEVADQRGLAVQIDAWALPSLIRSFQRIRLCCSARK